MLIPSHEVQWHGSSHADPAGRVFRWQGRLLRGISTEGQGGLAEFVQSGKVQVLVERGLLVPTEVTNLRTEEFDLVVEHQEIAPVSYPFEWCASMLRDAAVLILDLQIELARSGYHLKDSHTWNVVFDGPRPVYVDLGSIEAGSTQAWVAAAEFRQFALNPLQLYAAGHGRVANDLLRDFLEGVPDSVARALGPNLSRSLTNRVVDVSIDQLSRHRSTSRALSLLRRLRRRITMGGPSDAERLRRIVTQIDLGIPPTRWSSYYDDDFPRFDDRGDWSEKHLSFAHALESVKPRNLLDIAGNRGWYAQYAASQGAIVTAFDYDESAVRLLYADVKERGFRVLPIVMDVQRPSPGEGLGFSYMPTSVDRFRSEMVIALALCHHICYFQNVPLSALIRECASYARGALLFEFIEPGDDYVAEWIRDTPAGYSLVGALDEMRNLYPEVTVLPSNLPTRHLLLGQGQRTG